MSFWWGMFICNMLVPVIMIGGGYFMWKHCPGKINSVLGYRTKRSMRNMDTWKFAHEYCGRLWWKTGWILVIPTILLQLLFIKSSTDKISIFSLAMISIQTLILLLTIIPTENALKKKFDQ